MQNRVVSEVSDLRIDVSRISFEIRDGVYHELSVWHEFIMESIIDEVPRLLVSVP